MEIFKNKTSFDFFRFRRACLIGSCVAMVGTVVALYVPGLNLGLDFAGGTEVELQLDPSVSTAELRAALAARGYETAEVVAVSGKGGQFVVRVKEDPEASTQRSATIESALREALGSEVVDLRTAPSADRIAVTTRAPLETTRLREAVEHAGHRVLSITDAGSATDARYVVTLRGAGDVLVESVRQQLGERAGKDPLRVEWVGPKAGKHLRDAAIKAGLFAMGLILVYVAFRFDLRFAPGAILALFHDAMIVIGVYALVQKEFTLGTVAAILTVIGYSINDTIVIFDRVRENLARSRDAPLAVVLNQSLNETLSRTIITSSVTLLAIVGFFVWGTPVVKDITFALAVGFVSGTYSTVCIAVPLVEWVDKKL